MPSLGELAAEHRAWLKQRAEEREDRNSERQRPQLTLIRGGANEEEGDDA